MSRHRITTPAALDEIDNRHDWKDSADGTGVWLASWELTELVRLARLGLEYERLEREAMEVPSSGGKLFDLPNRSHTDPQEGD